MPTKTTSFTFRLFTVWMLLVILLAVALGVTGARAASTITVNSLADNVAVDGNCTLREAIQNATNHAATNIDCAAGSGGDTINFSVSGTITLGSMLPYIHDDGGLTIDGTGQTVTINGNHAVQLAEEVGGASLTLNNLTLANGNSTGGSSTGGAMYSSGALTISNCTFSGNSASVGGAIYKLVGTLTITNSTFSGNSASGNGGGIYNDGGTLTITNSTFSGNSVPSGYGGGIYSSAGTVTITNGTFSGNSAYLGRGGGIYKSIGTLTITDSIFSSNNANGGDGGGIYNDAGALTITNSSFSDNSASGGLGGGIYNGYPNPLTVRGSTFSTNSAGSGGGVYNNGYAGYPSAITNSTFSGNSASGIGGGIYNNAGTLTVTNSSFSGNSASGSGGGVNRTGGTFTLRNTIVDNNTGGNCSGAITNAGNNIDSGVTCGWGSTNGSMSNTNPLLGALTGSPAYFPLNAGSPAIDAGEDSICAAWPVNNESQNGVTRPQGAHCDIGSYELVKTAVPTVTSITRLNPSPTSAANVNFTVTFSESVTGVDSADFVPTTTGVTGASITTLSGSGTTYTVTVNTGTGDGTIRLDVVDDNSIKDAANNALGGVNAGDGNFTSGETYTIIRASVDITVGSEWKGTYLLPSVPSLVENYLSIVNGPVKMVSSNGSPFFTSQRVTSGDSYNELLGMPSNQFTTEYWFPYYDHGYPNVAGSNMRTWILVGNPSTTQTATVNIYIGGVLQSDPNNTSSTTFSIAPGSRVTPRWVGKQGGPVRVVSTNGVNIFASERVFTSNNAFNESLGLAANKSTTEYWFPWYDNVNMRTSIAIGNTSTTKAAKVTIYVGGVKNASFTIAAKSTINLVAAGLVNGPVRVVSTNGVKIVTSENAVSGPSNSFSDVMGYPFNQFTTEYWFPNYDHGYPSVGGSNMRTWILVGNPSTTQTATVQIYIGGVLQSDPGNSSSTTFSIPPGRNITPRWVGKQGGPVRVLSNIPIFASERVFTIPNSIFNEMMGYPSNQMTTEYWYPWYDSVNMNNDILVGKP